MERRILVAFMKMNIQGVENRLCKRGTSKVAHTRLLPRYVGGGGGGGGRTSRNSNLIAEFVLQKGSPWELLYADDLALMAESEQELMAKMSSWQATLEGKG